MQESDGDFQEPAPSCSYPTTSTTSHQEDEQWLQKFLKWNAAQEMTCVRNLLLISWCYQKERINYLLQPLMKRDFISLCSSRGLDHVSQKILTYLDPESLANAELVCQEWKRVIAQEKIWKRLVESKIQTDFRWKEWINRRNLLPYMFRLRPDEKRPSHYFYSWLFQEISRDLERMESNWVQGNYGLNRIDCESTGRRRGVYCLQYDNQKVMCGLRDNTIKIWDRQSRQCTKVFTGHRGSVLCLQYNDTIIISGSSDTSIRVWDIDTGETIYEITHHSEAVLHLKFNGNVLVTCSKDWSVVIWKMDLPRTVILQKVLVGHRAAVNVVDFDERYIVSGAGDRTIKVWDTTTGDFIRSLIGHRRGIACLQFKGNLIASGSSDCTIRLWDVEGGTCLRTLEGHANLVRCIRFDSKRIVSGCYGGKIKLWDLPAALDPDTPDRSLCVQTLTRHVGRIFRIQFDEFQIVSCGHDDRILFWDFLDTGIEPPPLINPFEHEGEI